MSIKLRKQPATSVRVPTGTHVQFYVDSDGVPKLKDSNGNITSVAATGLVLLDEAVATNVLAGFMSAAGFAKLSRLLSPLIADRTVHVNSVTGNDTTGDGSSGLPWQTLARAWVDRLTYGDLRAVYTIQLHGVDPSRAKGTDDH
jgi:hypothetical protein